MSDEQINDAEYEAFRAEVMARPDMMAQIEAMPPDEREKYIRDLFRDYVGETEVLNEQALVADRMRSQEGPEGRYTRNAYVAANPLEHIGSTVERVKGNIDYNKAMAGKETMSADKSAAQAATAELMRKGMQDNIITLEQQANKGRYMVDEATDRAAQKQLEQARLMRMYGTPT